MIRNDLVTDMDNSDDAFNELSIISKELWELETKTDNQDLKKIVEKLDKILRWYYE